MPNIETSNFFHQFPQLSLEAGLPIAQAHDQIDKVFYIEQGHVRQYIISPQGIELTVHLFKPGSFFPLMQALNHTPNRYSYDAFTSVELFVASSQQVEQFLKEHPEILFDLSQRLLMGLDGLLTRIEVVAFGSASLRVADGLVFLAKHFGEETSEGLKINHKLTHKNIAQIVGLARETTSLELERLSKSGTIKRDGDTLLILDFKQLQHLAMLD